MTDVKIAELVARFEQAVVDHNNRAKDCARIAELERQLMSWLSMSDEMERPGKYSPIVVRTRKLLNQKSEAAE